MTENTSILVYLCSIKLTIAGAKKNAMSSGSLKKIVSSSNINTYLSSTLIIITVATTLLIGGVLVFQQTLNYKLLVDKTSAEFIVNQKAYVKEIVDNEFEYIRLQNEGFKFQIKDKIKQNVNQAINTAESIYNKYYGKKSENEIKELIISIIASLKFEMEYEQVFISDLDGTGIYYPRKPEFTGRNMRRFKDINGSPVVQAELDLLKTNKEGFLQYSNLPDSINTAKPGEKFSYVKKFGHFNWYFGSKQYLHDYFPKFKDEIAQKIGSRRFRYGGYIFMNQTDGKPILMDGKIYNGPINLLVNADSARKKVFEQELNTLKNNANGGFFYYQWNKMNEKIPTEKCSYVKLFKEYNWIIGAGFYLDEINQSIKEQQANLLRDQKKSIFSILLILVILLFLEALIIYRFNKRYKSDFERFFNFFFASQNSFDQLNISELHFDEFKRAGIAANKMIMLREEVQNSLIEEKQKAKESDRLKSAFLANMSHEIRTPMNSIIGFSELLEDNDQEAKDKEMFIKLIQKNGEILLNLINDIIDISKIEANLLSIRKRPLQLNKFLNELNNHYTETLSTKIDKHIQFILKANINQDISILTDEIRLRQILDNLIGNAIKFTHSGTVSLEVNIKDDAVHFNISDTGIGIAANQQATIFERFIQADQGPKVNFGGTGLGLAISKNLVELLGGNIHVKSELGRGSTFFFHIQAN